MNVANEKPASQLVDDHAARRLVDTHREHDENQRSSSRWSPWLRAPVSKGARRPEAIGDATSVKSG